MVAFHDQLGVAAIPISLIDRMNASFREGQISSQRTGNECNLFMTQGGQVLYRLTNTMQYRFEYC